jgi:hypothetical protein
LIFFFHLTFIINKHLVHSSLIRFLTFSHLLFKFKDFILIFLHFPINIIYLTFFNLFVIQYFLTPLIFIMLMILKPLLHQLKSIFINLLLGFLRFESNRVALTLNLLFSVIYLLQCLVPPVNLLVHSIKLSGNWSHQSKVLIQLWNLFLI